MIICSDLSEVLCGGIYGMENIIENLYGKEAAKDFLKSRIAVNDKILELFRGNCNEDEYWDLVLKTGSLPITLTGIKHVFKENIKQSVPGTLELYKSIQSHPRSICNGVQSGDSIIGRPEIYITSDHIRERINTLHQLHPEVFEIMTGEIWSCDLGMVKGDEGFFPAALARINVPPEKIVFVDDIKKNIESARRSGIYSIHFQNAEQLEDELKKVGFTFKKKEKRVS